MAKDYDDDDADDREKFRARRDDDRRISRRRDDEGGAGRRRYEDDDDFDDDDDYPRRRRWRDDLEPHRGTLILVLGILAFVICGLFGIPAWIMGSADLKAMAEGRMDPEGEGMTKAGYILGIVSSVLVILGVVLGGLWVILIATMVAKGR
jgi:hypothetical protein